MTSLAPTRKATSRRSRRLRLTLALLASAVSTGLTQGFTLAHVYADSGSSHTSFANHESGVTW